MKLGIRAHDVGTNYSLEELIQRLKEYGLDNIQLVFKKALPEYKIFTEANAKEVGKVLKEKNVNVSMLGAYFNPVHSNKELVKQNIEYFKEHLKHASLVNCNYVGTETGSYNDDKWTYNPKNQTEEGYQDTIKVFKELIKTAEENKTTLLMEPAYGHVIYSVEQLKRAYDELNSKYLKVTIDIYNLIYIGNYRNYKEIFTKALKTFKDNIKIIHLKDFYVNENTLIQTGLGKGIIDFNYLVNEIKTYCPNATMILEGVTGEDITPSVKLIKSLM